MCNAVCRSLPNVESKGMGNSDNGSRQCIHTLSMSKAHFGGISRNSWLMLDGSLNMRLAQFMATFSNIVFLFVGKLNVWFNMNWYSNQFDCVFPLSSSKGVCARRIQ